MIINMIPGNPVFSKILVLASNLVSCSSPFFLPASFPLHTNCFVPFPLGPVKVLLPPAGMAFLCYSVVINSKLLGVLQDAAQMLLLLQSLLEISEKDNHCFVPKLYPTTASTIVLSL